MAASELHNLQLLLQFLKDSAVDSYHLLSNGTPAHIILVKQAHMRPQGALSHRIDSACRSARLLIA